MKNAWAPILAPGTQLATRARESVDAISQAVLTRNYPLPATRTREHCCYEESLLYGYVALASRDPQWMDHANESLNAAIDLVSQRRYHAGLFGGLCGLGWAVQHLSTALAQAFVSDAPESTPESENTAADDPIRDIDAVVVRHLRRGRWQGPYDLISGLVGFGTYFLERWPNGEAAEGISLIIDHLEAMAEQTDAGITWHSGPELLPDWQRRLCPSGYYNLGVAHGIPGIIHFLSELVAADIETGRAWPLLAGAIDWLIAHQRPPGSLSRFSGWIAAGESADARMSWCYGDLGVMAVMSQVAHRSGRADWSEFSQGLVEHCLDWPPDKLGNNDAPLCHGAAGVAHIFNRIYQTDGDPRCLQAAVFHFERALQMRSEGGVGGYFAFTRPDPYGPPVWEPSPAFLDGASGIALALLGALTPVEPEWDRLLLVSGRHSGLNTGTL